MNKKTLLGIGRKFFFLLLAFLTCSIMLWFGKIQGTEFAGMVTVLGGWYFTENRKQKKK